MWRSTSHLRHGEAEAGFDMAFRHRLDAGADDLGRVGAEIDHHGEEGGSGFAEFQPERRQAEEDEEQLHDERRVADHFDIDRDDAAEPYGPEGARRGAGGADRDAGHRRDDRQHDREDQALQEHVPVGQQFGELQFVGHGGRPGVALQKPGGKGAFSHFSDSLAISPDAFALVMISLTLASSAGSFLLSPT